MAKQDKSSKKQDAAAKSKAPLEDFPALYQAALDFVRDRTEVESAAHIERALEAMGRTATPMELFRVPVDALLFGMEDALVWLLFLRQARAFAAEEGDKDFGAINVGAAMDHIAGTYDIGVSEHILHYFGGSDSDSGSDSGSSEGMPNLGPRTGRSETRDGMDYTNKEPEVLTSALASMVVDSADA